MHGALFCIGLEVSDYGHTDSTHFSLHMPSILRQWFRSGLAWQDFPFTLAGYRDIKSFIDGCAAQILVPEFVLWNENEIHGKNFDARGEIACMRQVREYLGV